MNRDRLFALIYLSLLAIHLVSGEIEFSFLTALTKPALLTSLIVYFFLNLSLYGKSPFAYLILFGLVFSLGGDVVLMFQDRGSFFIFGLGSFMLAHVLYIIAFSKTYEQNHEIKLLKRYGWVMILVVGYGYFFFNAIKEFLHDMIGPVMVYTMVISLMLLIALNRYKKVSPRSFRSIAIGAILFVASDSILAWNKFVHELDHSHFLIMITYGLAQYCISYGAVIQVRDISVKSIEE